MTSRGPTAWWIEAFRRPYLACYAHRDDASAEREARFVASLLGLERGARLLDAGCGAGRHARAFARRGARVAGVDLSEELLAEARSALLPVEGSVAYALADVRALPFAEATFAHAVSLFTSFGYFDEAGDRAQLGEARRVLARGGTFVLDYLNATGVEAKLVAESERRVGDLVIRERRRIAGGRVEKHVVLVDQQGEAREWTESVRLYGRDDLTAMLSDAGLRVVSVHGDLAGGKWSAGSDRLVLCAVAS